MKDPEDFQLAFDEMIEYVSKAENWDDIEDELRSRGVSVFLCFLVLCNFFFFFFDITVAVIRHPINLCSNILIICIRLLKL